MDTITTNLQKIEDKGWIGTANKHILRPIVAWARSRKAPTIFTKVKGHSGDIGNDGADALAGLGALKEIPDKITLEYPTHLTVNGAKLSKMTQSLAYKGILEKKKPPKRRATEIMLDKTRYAVEEMTGEIPSDNQIWMSIKNPNIPRNIKGFIWRCLHDAHKVGHFWTRMQKAELCTRGECQHCGKIEDMEHILTDCQVSAHELIWTLAERTWATTGQIWKKPTMGNIMGCSMNTFKNDEGRPNTTLNRLYTILLTEAVHLIWKIRCEWRIGKEGNPLSYPRPEVIEARWHSALYHRLQYDRWSTSNRHGRRATKPRVIVNMWKYILHPDDVWTIEKQMFTGVLVKRGIRRPKGRNQ